MSVQIRKILVLGNGRQIYETIDWTVSFLASLLSPLDFSHEQMLLS